MTAVLFRNWPLAVITLLLVALSVQAGRISHGEKRIAELQLAHAQSEAARQQALLDHTQRLQVVRDEHAARIKEKDDEHHEKMAALDKRRRADADAARGLRSRLAAVTARSRTGVAPTAADCERDQDRLERVGGLAGEGAELLVEARSLLRQRDLEVSRLLDQIAIDRRAVEQAAGL